MIPIIIAIILSLLMYLINKLSQEDRSILILGPNAAGKTTLFKFLTENKIIKDYIKSPIAEKGSLKSIQINNLKITTAVTMPGDELNIKAWISLDRRDI